MARDNQDCDEEGNEALHQAFSLSAKKRSVSNQMCFPIVPGMTAGKLLVAMRNSRRLQFPMQNAVALEERILGPQSNRMGAADRGCAPWRR